MKSKWTEHALCKCGWHKELVFGTMFSLSESVCPQCGKDIRQCKKKSMRFIWKIKWYNPMTWFTVIWEIKNEN